MRIAIAALLIAFCVSCTGSPTDPFTPCDKERMRNDGRHKRQHPTECDEWLLRNAEDNEKRMRPVRPDPGPPAPPTRRRTRPIRPH